MYSKKPIKSTCYLYGVPPKVFLGKPYEEVLKLKLKYGKELVRKLGEEMSNIFNSRDKIPEAPEKYRELAIRLNDVIKAIEFNEQALRELEDVSECM